jgi:membrane-associated phospholipid phosphatase
VGGAIFTASEITGRVAWFWALFIVCFNILLPSGYILWLKRRGKVTDFDVYLREQRFWPYVFSISCGAISWLAMAFFHAPRLMTIISGATVGQGLVMFLINQRWKISAHSAGIAGIAVLLWQIIGPSGAPILLVIPLVGWSRVRLGRHTLGQVIMGAALGATIFFSALAIWY